MKNLFSLICLAFALAFFPASSGAEEAIHHDLKVTLHPDGQHLSVVDTITLPEAHPAKIELLLHAGLQPSSSTPGVLMGSGAERDGHVPLELFRLELSPPIRSFTIEYGGSIYHPTEQGEKEQARGMMETPGLISREGVFLSGSTFWYPRIGEELITFSLDVTLPGGWDSVSQGRRSTHKREEVGSNAVWESPEPQDEIYLVAAPFIEYRRKAGRIEAMAFLRTPDEKLAEKYLDATAGYISMYEKLIGPYPYAKFALVENFWETGFGMPSFTLLGPKVVRLPFILNTSYPHEILHNWWGNSVFPEYEKGNWSEGLTAYLADHLMKEQVNNAAEYRQTTLQKYADYVQSEKDFPLTRFRSRHSSSSEAVGYGKSLMFFHMLRQELGNKTFTQVLRNFYAKHKFQFASFDELRESFQSISGKSVGVEFDQWTKRVGAPQIKMSGARAEPNGDGYILRAMIEQVQPEDPYLLHVPLAVTFAGHEQTFQTVLDMRERQLEIELRLPAKPLRIDVDPEFDLFRRLDREETPPALTRALGAKQMLILLPSSAGKELLMGYRNLSDALARSGPDHVEIRLDSEVKELPVDRAVALLGRENRFLDEMSSALAGYEVSLSPTRIRIGQTEVPYKNHSFVLTARNRRNSDFSLTWIASDLSSAIPGLGRKLPHYHKYSYLAFVGEEPANVVKGRWPVIDSPMTAFIPDEGGKIQRADMGKLAAREPLAAPIPAFSKERMIDTIQFLAGDDMKGRGFGTEELGRAAEFIAERFRKSGLAPAGDNEGSFFQSWQDVGGDPEKRVTLKNVVGVIPGKKPEYAGQSVIVAAHYDHLGLGWPEVRQAENKGKVHPGADDNASGTAVLIELAQVLAKSLNPDRSVVFIAFTGEEAGRRGSRHYVEKAQRYPAQRCIGMLNLDTVGRLGDKKLLILGGGSAKEWVHIFREAGLAAGVAVEPVSDELDASDQKSFLNIGIPAVQFFSGPHPDYHRPTDTVDRIDSEGLIKTISVAREVIEYLASREEPLTATIQPGEGKSPGASQPSSERKISLGIIPDFSYSGEGCRLSGVMPGSPAESRGLKTGDIIVKINTTAIRSLKDLSDSLKSLAPENKVTITFLREGREMSVDAVVKAK